MTDALLARVLKHLVHFCHCVRKFVRGGKAFEGVALNAMTFRAQSIHRTHAYAVHRRALPAIIGHLLDTLEMGKNQRHVDHHYEMAHQAGLWPAYSTSWWLAGQGAHKSSISGLEEPAKWWHYCDLSVVQIPVIVTEVMLDECPMLHYGHWPAVEGKPNILEAGKRCPLQTRAALQSVWRQALELGRLPAVVCSTAGYRRVLRQAFPQLEEFDAERVSGLVDYPQNGMFKHPWIHP